MIELGGDSVPHPHDKEGEVIFGRPRSDDEHLKGFVTVNHDFEPFTHGDEKTIQPEFSLAIKNQDQLNDPKELVKFFKDGGAKEEKAFIVDEKKELPEGFKKVQLPYLDKDTKDLPSVFIAPIGYKVPPGYKGIGLE